MTISVVAAWQVADHAHAGSRQKGRSMRRVHVAASGDFSWKRWNFLRAEAAYCDKLDNRPSLTASQIRDDNWQAYLSLLRAMFPFISVLLSFHPLLLLWFAVISPVLSVVWSPRTLHYLSMSSAFHFGISHWSDMYIIVLVLISECQLIPCVFPPPQASDTLCVF